MIVKTVEIRSIENESGERILEGLIPYNAKSEDMGFVEIIMPGAFTKTLKESRKIFALWNHDERMVIANTENGSLSFDDTPQGLHVIAKLNNTSYANDAWEQIKSGTVRTMSFAFRAINEEWDGEKNIRILREIKLYEVSFGVPFPAYENTTSEAVLRSIDMLDENQRDKIITEIERRYKPRVNDRPQDAPVENTPEEKRTLDNKLSLYEAKIKLFKYM